MAQAALTDAPLKRKIEDPSEAKDSKKPQQVHQTEIERNLAQSRGIISCNGELNVASSAEPSGEGELKATEIDGNLLKGDDKLAKPSAEASGSGSAGLEEAEGLGEGEVLEVTLEQDDGDDEEQGDEEEEMSGIDTENDNVDDDDDEEEDASSDEDEDDDDSDDEEDEDKMPTSTSSSLRTEAVRKGEARGKEKVVDVKGKGIMIDDKGKGKAIAEDESVPHSDDDDTGYLSEDPLDEVDLNNILPTRTRRRSSSTHYDFVDQGEEEDDDDDDSDA